MNLLVISRDCFSQTNANGQTLKALLRAFSPDELMQFYTGVDSPDFAFCNSYFRVTDVQMMKSFIRCPDVVVREKSKQEKTEMPIIPNSGSKIWSYLRANNYNYVIRLLREYLWSISPRWKKRFEHWLKKMKPSAILYMVGDSFFLDKLVTKASKQFNIPVILFNVEAYRIIDCNQRSGFDKLYNKISERSYCKLQQTSSLVIYNCSMLKEAFWLFYTIDNERSSIVYNTYIFDNIPYNPVNNRCNIVYFGNLGVGRIGSLIDIADTLYSINETLIIDVYGKAPEEELALLINHRQIRYHGLVNQKELSSVKENADILLQVESFDPIIMKKLRFAFSTKIAQCLCAGRALLSYAPLETASTQYLKEMDAAVIAVDKISLKAHLMNLINDPILRMHYANKALEVAKENHDSFKTGELTKRQIKDLL